MSVRAGVTAAGRAGSLHSGSVQALRVRDAGSTSTNCAPASVVTRYQNRPSASQVGRTPLRSTSGAVLEGMKRSARA
jgi:hypothetical protein